MLEILWYSFFQNALIWWILISLISSILWVFIIMRKEANIAHSISNFIFLWIAFSLLLSWNYYLFWFIFAIIWALIIFFIEKTKFITKESTKEIISQAWIWWWIFLVWFLWNLQIDIFNFLFWSILFINKIDLIIIFCLFLIWYVLLYFYWKNFLAVIISEEISKTKWIKVSFYNISFIIFLSIFIWISIKIFWILLIWAFLVIPANTAKILAWNLKQVFIFSIIISLIWVIFWLFWSYFLQTSSWATIVVLLVLIFILSLIFKKLIKN